MSYAQHKQLSGNRTVAIVIVALLHAVLGYAIVTGLAYNVIKKAAEDLKTFDAGNIIDQTDVYDFAWKSTGERSYGVIAQQAVEVYPAAVTHSMQDDKPATEFWGVDYSKYVPVLLQEMKAMRATLSTPWLVASCAPMTRRRRKRTRSPRRHARPVEHRDFP